jgi:hypothetical protein
MLSHDRRRIVHFGVTAHPTAEWTAQQLINAFPWSSTPRYLLRDRDGSYGEPFPQAAKAMQVREVLTAPRSPCQNAYVERLIGSILNLRPPGPEPEPELIEMLKLEVLK